MTDTEHDGPMYPPIYQLGLLIDELSPTQRTLALHYLAGLEPAAVFKAIDRGIALDQAPER